MFVTTHTIVATTIAVKTGNPWIYIPAAAVDHFLLDLAPHFGLGEAKTQKAFLVLGILDAIFGTGFFVYVLVRLNFPILNLFLVDLLAGWPDVVYVYYYFFNTKFLTKFNLAHAKIQKLESRWGVLVEILVIAVCFYVLTH